MRVVAMAAAEGDMMAIIVISYIMVVAEEDMMAIVVRSYTMDFAVVKRSENGL